MGGAAAALVALVFTAQQECSPRRRPRTPARLVLWRMVAHVMMTHHHFVRQPSGHTLNKLRHATSKGCMRVRARALGPRRSATSEELMRLQECSLPTTRAAPAGVTLPGLGFRLRIKTKGFVPFHRP